MKKTAKNVLGLFFCILMISMCTGTIPAFAASSGIFISEVSGKFTSGTFI